MFVLEHGRRKGGTARKILRAHDRRGTLTAGPTGAPPSLKKNHLIFD